MSNYSRGIFFVVLAAFVSAASAPVHAQGYPTKPITLIVPTGPGGTTDVVARIISVKLGEVLGRPVVAENKVGAGGIIGTQAAAKASPDGHTLMISANTFTMLPALYNTPPYDVQSFIPITTIGDIELVLVVNPQIPIGSVDDLIALAKRNPDRLTFGSAGNGTPNHFYAEMLNMAAGVKIVHVPYKGIAAAVSDVVAGRLSMAITGLSTVQAFLNTGRLKALAVTSQQRSQVLPNVQTVGESVPGYSADVWFGILAVANTPDPVTERIYAAMQETLRDPDIRRRLIEIGFVIKARTRAQFQSLIQSELEMWAKIVRDSKGAIVRQ